MTAPSYHQEGWDTFTPPAAEATPSVEIIPVESTLDGDSSTPPIAEVPDVNVEESTPTYTAASLDDAFGDTQGDDTVTDDSTTSTPTDIDSTGEYYNENGERVVERIEGTRHDDTTVTTVERTDISIRLDNAGGGGCIIGIDSGCGVGDGVTPNQPLPNPDAVSWKEIIQ